MSFSEAEFIKGAARWEHLPTDGRAEVAFVGRSNVGKSSLINAVLGRKKLARTSKRPGKTTEFNYYLVDRAHYLVDLPGFGYAKASKADRERWAEMIDRYLHERHTLRAVVHLVDSRHPPMESDEDVIDAMRPLDTPYLIALTKADKLSGNGRAQSRRRVETLLDGVGLQVPLVLTSAKTGRGISDLRQWIGDFL
jgi:GTP-binding protein